MKMTWTNSRVWIVALTLPHSTLIWPHQGLLRLYIYCTQTQCRNGLGHGFSQIQDIFGSGFHQTATQYDVLRVHYDCIPQCGSVLQSQGSEPTSGLVSLSLSLSFWSSRSVNRISHEKRFCIAVESWGGWRRDGHAWFTIITVTVFIQCVFAQYAWEHEL